MNIQTSRVLRGVGSLVVFQLLTTFMLTLPAPARAAPGNGKDEERASRPVPLLPPPPGAPATWFSLGGGHRGAVPRDVALPPSGDDAAAAVTFTDLPAADLAIDGILPSVPQNDFYASAFASDDGQVCVLAQEGYELRAMHSGNAGQTFGPDIDVAGGTGQKPVTGYDAVRASNGSIYVVMRVADPAGHSGLQTVRSDDMCRTWTTPLDILNDPSPLIGVRAFDIAAGSAGFVAVLFSGGNGNDPWVRVSSDSGATWGSNIRIDNGVSSGTAPTFDVALAVDESNDNIYAVWTQTRSGVTALWYNRSTDGGATFVGETNLSSLVTAHEAARRPEIVVTADGSVVITVWDSEADDHIYVLQCTSAGASCAQVVNQALGAATGDNVQLFPRLETRADIDGSVLVHYVDESRALQVATSTNNGTSFGAFQPLASAVRNEWEDPQWLRVEVARAPGGQWAIGWTDRRDDTYTGQKGDIYVRTSSDGSTWDPEARADSDGAGASFSVLHAVVHTARDEWLPVWFEARDDRASWSVYANRSPAATLAFGTDYRIDTDDDTMSPQSIREPSVTTDGAGNVYVGFSSFATDQETDIFVARSSDGGYTFGTPVRIGSTPAGAQAEWLPVIAATSDGYVYVAFGTDNPSTGLREVRFQRSTDFGATWLPTDKVLGSLSYESGYWVDFRAPGMQVSAQPGGKVYVAWSDFATVWLSRSTDGGANFTTTDVDQDTRDNNNWPVMCSQGNQVILAYVSPDDAFAYWSVWGTVSDDNGVSWSPRVQLRPEGVGNGAWYPSLACDGSSSAIVLFSDFRNGTRYQVYANRYNGTSWEGSELVSGPAGDDVFPWARGGAAFASASNVLVSMDNFAQSAVYVARSTNGGDSFPSHVQIDSAAPEPSSVSFFSQVVADGADNAWVSWIDWSAGPSAVVGRHTGDGGASFGAVRRINRDLPQGAFNNDYFPLGSVSIASSGAAFFVFAGEREGPTAFDWGAVPLNSTIVVNAWDLDDLDRDESAGLDCDDDDPTVYPGAPQACDGVNNDCDDGGWPTVPANEGDDDLDLILDCADNCANDSNPGQDDYDGDGTGDACDSPAVTEVAPADNAVDVNLATAVSIRFDEPVDPLTIDGTSFKLFEGMTPIAATVTVTDDGLTATLDPTAALNGSATHRVEVTTAAQDSFGNPVVAFESFFKTEATASTQVSLSSVSDLTEPPPNATDARVGSAVAAAGDLNPPFEGADTSCDGPGLQDLVVGAPGYVVNSNTEAGAAIVYLGSTVQSERESPDIIFTGEAAHDRAGVSVAGGHDFNGDGYPDIVIGAEMIDRTQTPAVATGAGKVYLIYFDPSEYPNIGDPNTSDTVSLADVGSTISGVVFTGETNGDQAGFSLAIGASVNPGEGPDLLIGAPGRDPVVGDPPATATDAGQVYMVVDDPSLTGTIGLDRVACSADSSCGAFSEVNGQVFLGETAGDALGYSVAFVGDVVAGPANDFAMAAPFFDPNLLTDAGAAYLQPGEQTVNRIIVVCDVVDTEGGTQVSGDQAEEELGASMGVASLLIGASRYDVGADADAGRVLEATEKLPAGRIDASSIGNPDGGDPDATDGIIWLGAAAGDQLGVSGYGLFDVTGNGLVDLGLGAPFADPMGVSDAGIVYVIEGSTATGRLGTQSVALVGDTISGQQLIGTETDENAGTSLIGVCDFDGDGDNDVAIGSPGRDVGAESDAGVVYIAQDIEPDAPGSCDTLGCTITDLDNGAQLVVAAGALGGPADLGVTGLMTAPDLPGPPPAPKELLAATRYIPDGQTFVSPFATATLPTVASWEDQLSGGDAFDFFYWNGSAWIDSGIDGTVVVNPEYPARKAVSATVDTLRVYAAFVADQDGDGTRDALDADRDGDGEDNASDCLPDDGDTWAIPSDVDIDLTSSGSTAILDWLPPAMPGGNTVLYDTIRSTRKDDFVFSKVAVCIESDDTDTTASDPSVPATAFYYVVRPENACGGTAGKDSDGVERNARTCP